MPLPLKPRRIEPQYHLNMKAGWAPESSLDFLKKRKMSSSGNRKQDHAARSLVTTPITIFRFPIKTLGTEEQIHTFRISALNGSGRFNLKMKHFEHMAKGQGAFGSSLVVVIA